MKNRIFRYVAMVLLLVIVCDYKANCCAIPVEEQWYIFGGEKYETDIQVREMWKLTKKVKNKRKVVIALIDTGVDASNSAISAVLWKSICEIPNNGIDDDHNGYIDDINGWNFADNDNNISEYETSVDELSHGTKIAGIICSDWIKGKNYGIADNQYVSIMTLKVLTGGKSDMLTCSGDVSNVISAIEYAEKNGADICNISLNVDRAENKLSNAIKNSEMLFVVSAGNRQKGERDLEKNPSYPASYNYGNVITVANIKSNGRLNTTSNYGTESVDLSAPGTDIYGIDVENRYTYGSGTSYATPIVTATAAMMYMCDDMLRSTECKKILCETAGENSKIQNEVKNGKVLNCKAAIQKLLKED